MAAKAKPLHGCSALVQPDGTVVPVRDCAGALQIDQAVWGQVRERAAQTVGGMVSDMVSWEPARKAAFGIPDGQRRATVPLLGLLQEKTPAGAECTDGCP